MILRANAKINLTLDILSKRADSYHEIDSLMQSVSVYDTLSIEQSNKTVITCTDSSLCDDNIVLKAANVFFGKTGISGKLKIHIEKNIPVCAGLGGGSADAAAVIVACNEIYKTGLSTEELIGIAAEIGADVPFFIMGGTARAQGIGEILTRVKPFGSFGIVLLKEGEKASTGEMYRCLDEQTASRQRNTSLAVDLINSGENEKAIKLFSNDFSLVSMSPAVSKIEKTNPLYCGLSGSGPTVFGIYRNEKTADFAAKTIGNGAFAVKSCDKAIEIIE